MRPAHDGMCCFICGRLELNPVEAVVEMPAKEPVSRISLGCQMAQKYFDSIVTQRLQGMGWFTICKLISKAEGRVVQEKTVKKWWAVEMELRNDPKTKQKVAA